MENISVIIPVYNCGKYIRQCIESVQRQTLKNLEIICVDDGSSDPSFRILQEMANSDKRLKVLQQKNLGAGRARNLGIEKARGRYITFLDADDYYLDGRALQRLLQCCVQSGVKACGGVMCQNIGGIEKKALNYKQLAYFSRQGRLHFLEHPLDYDFTTFIFERALILDNQIRFPDYSFYEDPPFLVKTLFYAQEYAIADVEFYCYRIRQTPKKFTAQDCQSLLCGLKENLEFAAENHVEKLFVKTLSRLEFEYGERILASLQTDRADGLQALLAVNDVVQKQPGYEGYTVRPLHMILKQMAFMQENYERKLLDGLKGKETCYIFGAGMVAQRFWGYLKKMGICEKVEGFLVTDKTGIKNRLEDVPVYEIAEFKEHLLQGHIYIAVNGLFVAEIVQALHEARIRDYEIVNTEMLNIGER